MASKICPDCNKSFYGRFNRCLECSQKSKTVNADDYELMQDADYSFDVDIELKKIDNWLCVCELCDKFGNDDCTRNDGEYQVIPNRTEGKDVKRLNKCPIYWYAKQGKTPDEVVRILSYV